MFGFIQSDKRGETDRLLAEVAAGLRGAGLRLAGFLQQNTVVDDDRLCAMDLVSIDGSRRIRISQDLGPNCQGCRLDPQGLVAAVGLVEASLAQTPPHLLIVNKFGKQEAEGAGFRPLIGAAIAANIPVLTAVSAKNEATFADFSGGIATRLPLDAARVASWCQSVVATAQNRG